MSHRNLPTKDCASCGRPFSWRKAWERSWDEVRYCSKACRRAKPGSQDVLLEDAILALLQGRSGTACPSEVARSLGGDDWRQLMEPTRRAARRLASRGRIVISQAGRPVANDFKGPIRLGLPT